MRNHIVQTSLYGAAFMNKQKLFFFFYLSHSFILNLKKIGEIACIFSVSYKKKDPYQASCWPSTVHFNNQLYGTSKWSETQLLGIPQWSKIWLSGKPKQSKICMEWDFHPGNNLIYFCFVLNVLLFFLNFLISFIISNTKRTS